jgi:hypothetical protein
LGVPTSNWKSICDSRRCTASGTMTILACRVGGDAKKPRRCATRCDELRHLTTARSQLRVRGEQGAACLEHRHQDLVDVGRGMTAAARSYAAGVCWRARACATASSQRGIVNANAPSRAPLCRSRSTGVSPLAPWRGGWRR